MSVTCTECGRELLVRIEGEVDHHASRALMKELSERVDTVLPAILTLDLGSVSFMDSSGIALVLRTWKRLSQLGGRMTLCHVPPQAAKVLRASGVDRLIPFEKNSTAQNGGHNSAL